MNQSTVEALAWRLNHLERQNRRWQWLVSVTVAVIGLQVVFIQVIPRRVQKVLEAEMFVLRDTDGKSRAALGLVDDATFLLLNDRDGRPGVTLSVLPDGPRMLSLLDKDGRTRSVLTAQADGDSGLRLFDKDRLHRASLDVMADGRPILRLSEKDTEHPGLHRVIPDTSRTTYLWDLSPLRVAVPDPATKSSS